MQILFKLPHNCTHLSELAAAAAQASKVMLKIFQAKLQQYLNHELPDVQTGFRKGRRTSDQIANIHWIIEKAREFQKNIYFCFTDCAKAFDCVDQKKKKEKRKEGRNKQTNKQNCVNTVKMLGIPDHLTCLLGNCMQVIKQLLELDMEQQTGSN